MVNVLVGIIGVLLFIALALAGAAFIGPRFMQAMANSKAMSVTQMTSQITMALSLRRGDEGVPVVARTQLMSLVPKGYLKTLPLNPFIGEGGFPFRVLYSGDVESSLYYADIVFGSLGHGNEMLHVCQSINRQANRGDDVPQMALEAGTNVTAMVKEPLGCFQVHSAGIYGEANPGDYVVYSRI
ncbi:hypothetical protein [Novosphingobium sp. 17-62-19]|uniref:hypothetical protein n=1 Tax=Novosphingobium sp. 17-62-19 TaxID=1970406 RepID=UPI0025D2D08E|nr:hypothetical protein [Novosphingobium sp. 17-62-19]